MDSTMDSVHKRIKKAKEADELRDEAIEDLITQVKTLEAEQSELIKKRSMADYACEKYAEDLLESQKKVLGLQHEMNCNAFVLVLIDGDSMPFVDTLVKAGLAGGEEVATTLRNAVFEYLKDFDQELQRDTEIVVRVFARVEGLSKTYCSANVLSAPSHFDQFIRGFNRSHALCDFVDAGNDKEAADHKIKETMKLFYRNIHCKHILFGGSADNSYAVFLRQYPSSVQGRPTITLLEGIPFPSALAEVAKRFPKKTFEDVFRPVKLLSRRVSFRMEGRPGTPPKSPGVTYASTAGSSATVHDSEPVKLVRSESQSSAGAITTNVSNTGRTSATNGGNTSRICRNRYGQRIDLAVKHDQKIWRALKDRKLCNRYHLNNSCYHDPCTHDHKGKLTQIQLDTLRCIARLTPCPFGLDCSDEGCTAGHQCPSGSKCERDECRWGPEMHNVDMAEVKTITV